MMALGPGALALSLAGAEEDPLLAEAEGICAAQGATVIRVRPLNHRPETRRGLDLSRRRGPRGTAGDRARARRRHAGLDGGVLPGRETHRMSLGLGVIGCGSVFAGPYRAMIGQLSGAGRVHVSAVYDVDPVKRHGAAAQYDVDGDLRGPRGRHRGRATSCSC